MIAVITYRAFLSKRRPSADHIEQLCNSWTSCPGIDRASTDHRVERIAHFTVAGSPGMAFEARGDSIHVKAQGGLVAGPTLQRSGAKTQARTQVLCTVRRSAGHTVCSPWRHAILFGPALGRGSPGTYWHELPAAAARRSGVRGAAGCGSSNYILVALFLDTVANLIITSEIFKVLPVMHSTLSRLLGP